MLPFDEARALVERCYHIALSETTVRRWTYAAGKAAEATEAAFVEKLRRSLERPRERGPQRQQVSADGAMVRLRGGEWKEVRTLVIGTVTAGNDGPVLSEQSYYSRLCNHDTFIEGSRGEFFRRGTENVKDVEAVMDAADWLSQLAEEHCPNALRILDFTHAADAIVAAAHAAFGQGTAACAAWIGPQLHELRHGKAKNVLDALLQLSKEDGLAAATVETIQGRFNYLSRRQEQIQYASFAEDGYCIGSGAVESANRHVVQARLKGAGMQWAPVHVNQLLALRCADRNSRWASTWKGLSPRLLRPHRKAPQRARQTTPAPVSAPPPPPPPRAEHSPYFEDGKPTRAHPTSDSPPVAQKSDAHPRP